MIELCWGILFLGVAAAINWALGIYDKIGVEQLAWNWKEFVRGAVKIGIIVGSVIGVGFIWEFSGLDLSGAGIEPITMTTGATVLYAYKAIKHLAAIIKGGKKEATEVTEVTEVTETTTGGEQ
jgi:uncharacterized membrane protein